MKSRILFSSPILVALAMNAQIATAACDQVPAADMQHLRAAVAVSGAADTESIPFVVGKSADTEGYPLFRANCLAPSSEQASKDGHGASIDQKSKA